MAPRTDLALLFLPGLALWCWSGPARSEELLVSPHVQQLEPDSAWIVWETASCSDGQVQWGGGDALDQNAQGVTVDDCIQEAQLAGLQPSTRYAYRVQAGDAKSATWHFTTPSDSREASLRFVAISDTQFDSGNPDKLHELVHDGILDLVEQRYGSSPDQQLDFVLLPGDLVHDGWDEDEWHDEFFAPMAELAAQVPVYPAIGNHEANSPLYFHHFHLPDNATKGYAEHWWYLDRANLRVIGLDSNTFYAGSLQLEWVEQLLSATCHDLAVDFVVAQLHHPWKSELWPPGELDFTGEVIALLDDFATQCGKPAVHLFGHTHGYSRGQSLDAPHLWVNVATAAGNIDYWDEYDQIDYEEFTISLDEYGFVLFEVAAGDDPSLRLQRYGRGDEVEQADNALRDEAWLRPGNQPPATPEAMDPVGEGIDPHCVNLTDYAFCDPDGDVQGAALWQLAASCDEFSAPLYERWAQRENWYLDVDSQADDHLGDQLVGDLEPESDYCWRVRRRDDGLAWSDWSEPAAFSTGASTLSDNLLENPGAELGTQGWQTVVGPIESLAAGECDGIEPYAGQRYFAVGGLCEEAVAQAEARQRLDLSDWSAAIDAGDAVARFGGVLGSWEGNDIPELELRLLDEQERELAVSERLAGRDGDWLELQGHVALPVGTRWADFVLLGTLNAGNDNDSYFDELTLQLADDGALDACLAPLEYPWDDEDVVCEGEEEEGEEGERAGGGEDCGCGGRWAPSILLGTLALGMGALRSRRRPI